MYKYIVLVVTAVCIYGVRSQYEHLPVTQSCLRCICEAKSGCKVTSTCQGEMCGPFRISLPYWTDAGKPTVNDESPDSETAFKNCTLDPFCAALTVQGYMKRYIQDCDKNGKIDCDDFAAIHTLGGYGCGNKLPEHFVQRYQDCKKTLGNPGKYTTEDEPMYTQTSSEDYNMYY